MHLTDVRSATPATPVEADHLGFIACLSYKLHVFGKSDSGGTSVYSELETLPLLFALPLSLTNVVA